MIHQMKVRTIRDSDSKARAAVPIAPSKHLFRISAAAWEAASFEDVQATCTALKEAGLYALPYEAVDIEVPVDVAVNWTGPQPGFVNLRTIFNDDGTVKAYRSTFGSSVVIRCSSVTLDEAKPAAGAIIIDYMMNRIARLDDNLDDYVVRVNGLASACRALLIALLYTKNAVKVTTTNKLAKLGIGKKRPDSKYEYVTTISPPAARDMADDEEHPPVADAAGNRASPCPHLRRAHWKDQHFGPGRSYVKRILIQATYVLADREWTKTRTAYNVSL